MAALKGKRLTLVLGGLAFLALAFAAPGALGEALERGEIYLFTRRFWADIPARIAGPGRFRFVLQPVMAILLGLRDGLADARSGRRPYLGVFILGGGRRALLRSGLVSVVNLLLMSVLLDVVFQWVILGAAYPGAALVVGPVLIALPYSLARTVGCLVAARRRGPGPAGSARAGTPSLRRRHHTRRRAAGLSGRGRTGL